MLIDKIFDDQWFNSKGKLMPQLVYPLKRNPEFREEVEKWLTYFDNKGWLDQEMIKRLRMASSWLSFYSKMNELRAGYFFGNKLNFFLTKFNVPVLRKNVDFEGTVNNSEIYIEVKTPTEANKKMGTKRESGSFDNTKVVYDLLKKATLQLPDAKYCIVVLSDYLNVSLLDDIKVRMYTIPGLFKLEDFKKISAVCILGNVYHETLYKMRLIINSNATCLVRENIFFLKG